MYIGNTLNIHVKLTGEAAWTIEEMIRRGHAANKTEAVRVAILHYKYCIIDKQPEKCSIHRMKQSIK